MTHAAAAYDNTVHFVTRQPNTTIRLHWYDHRGDEATQASAVIVPFADFRVDSPPPILTFVKHLFVARDSVCNQVLFAFQVLARPYETRGAVVLAVGGDRASGGGGGGQTLAGECRRQVDIMAEDNREAVEQRQGPAPRAPPLSSKPRRGPWG